MPTDTTKTSTVAAPPKPRVLIADDSRIVRASIVQHIRDRFDIREVTDGEAAWQAILLDSSIRVVISAGRPKTTTEHGKHARRSIASSIAATDPFPFVPATRTDSKELSGCPRLASRARV